MNTTPIPARAIVLGAGGFLGAWMARLLTSYGCDTVLVVRSGSAERLHQWAPGGRIVRCDLTDGAAREALFAQHHPDAVFNLAGYGVDRTERDAELAEQLNHDVPRAVAEQCATLKPTPWRGARLIHVGSALEYGITGGVLRETSPEQPTTLYGRTKLAGSQAVRSVAERTGLRAFTGRLFTVFGPGEHAGRLFPTLVDGARSTVPIAVSAGTQRRDFAFAGDVVERLLQLASADTRPGEVINVASGVMHTVREFIRVTAAALGIAEHRLRFGGLPIRPEEMSHDGVAVDRLIELTGAALTGELAIAVQRAVDAMRRLEAR